MSLSCWNATKKEDREREKNLQKKLGDLQTQVQRLERRIALLRTENDTLRKKQDDHRPLEEKIKSLKKRNAELASIARRLEDKAKTLQQENSRAKSRASLSGQEEGHADNDQLKRAFARQRAKDLAEHAKSMLSKDHEIEQLRKKCQELANELGNGELMQPQNAPQFEEKEELVNIIKQAAKERLQLEQQLAHTKQRGKGDGTETPAATSALDNSVVEKRKTPQQKQQEEKRRELEEANQILHRQVEKLETALQKTDSLERDLSEKTQECQELGRQLSEVKEKNRQLEKSLLNSTTRNDQLQAEVRELQNKVKDITKITEECNGLKHNLVVAQKEREAAQEEVSHLNFRVESLESLVRDLQDAAEKVGQLENEKEEAVHQLQQTQGQVDQLHQNHQSLENEHEAVVETLRRQVKELEERRKAEEQRGENLTQEVGRLQRESEARQRALREAESQRQAAERTDKPTLTQESFVSVSTLPILASPSRVPLQSNPEERLDEKKEMELKHSGRPVDGSESFLSSWAQKGPIQVYIAKYNYDPFEYSPNENPEAELPLSAGDYVLVVGEMDEDGFFDGELIDGRQGLVPSNFIEKVQDDDLADFHGALMEAGHGEFTPNNGHSNLSTSRPLPSGSSSNNIVNNNTSNTNNNIDNDNVDSTDGNSEIKKSYNNAGQEEMDDSNSDLEDIAEIDEDSVSVNSRILANGGSTSSLPPCPRSLSVDKQLNSSLLVSWKGPEATPGLEVQSYHVLVDGQLKTSVKASERTKALLEGVNISESHRVCIQCLSNRGQSRDGQCTMLIGKDIFPQPSDLKISHLSPTSATLSWLSGNTNYQHSIVVNGKEMRLVKPGVFRHTLTGLSPGKKHNVALIAKSISGTMNEEKSKKWVENVTVHSEFTTPEAGSPEPPLNVQAESGPRERTILITWLPVTINASGVSNGAVVSGYHVMADGRQIKTVSGGTSDHVVLEPADFHGNLPTELTLRTVSTDGVQSADSDSLLLQHSLIEEISTDSLVLPNETGGAKHSRGSAGKPTKSQREEDQKGHDTDEEIEAAFREIPRSPYGVDADMASEPYTDTSGSELSDIAEVEEELLGSHDSNLNQLGEPVANEFASSHQNQSPKPMPRKNVAASDNGTKEFTSQKPDGGKLLMTPTRAVPAIEITRDSSSDRGASLDEETDRDSLSSTRDAAATPTQRSPENSFSPQYRSNHRNPSAFRQVDQSKDRDGNNKIARTDEPKSQSSIDEQDGYSNPDKNTKSLTSWNASVVSSSDPETQGSQEPEGIPHAGRNRSPDHRKNLTPLSSPPDGSLDTGGDADSISGEINSVVDENTVRLFIALFDYDPVTMSPNLDSIEEELPFREGQILKVYGDKDLDGFYRGESQGKLGFIPCNMVSEVQIDDPDFVDQLLKESMNSNTANNFSASSQTPTNEVFPETQIPASRMPPPGMRPGAVCRMVAMYDYDPQELSPNVDAELELSFKTGDIIIVYGDMDEDGFFTGDLNGQQGLVPSNFLQPAPLSDEDGIESASVVSATPRSRSGESLETPVNAVGRTDIPSNLSQVNEQIPNHGNSTKPSTSSTSPSELRHIETDHQNDSIDSALPAEEDKPKKKSGFFNRSKNMFKKLTR